MQQVEQLAAVAVDQLILVFQQVKDCQQALATGIIPKASIKLQ